MTFDTDAINNIKFTQGFRGYDTAEVDEFLDDMIREIEKLNNTIKSLKDELAKEKRKNQLSQQEIDRLTEINEKLAAGAAAEPAPVVEEKPAPVVEVKPAVVEEPVPIKIKKPASMEDIKGTPEYEEMKQILTDTLLSAQQHAEKLVKDAQERANKMIEEGERKAQDRVVALKAEISEKQGKLSTLVFMVEEAKKKFKKNFEDQIASILTIDTSEFKQEEVNINIPDYFEAETIEEEPEEATIAMADLPPLDDMIPDVEEKEEPVLKVEEPAAKPKEDNEVNPFDFSAIKRSLSQTTEKEAEPAPVAAPEEKPAPEIPAETEDDNQQYIEVALSAYNDNKHHNADYPNTSNNIKINDDDEEGGIYQPENRSVLSSVIEEILNNKRKDD